MATVTKSIGTGGSRDYSTITAWEADLDNAGAYASGDDAVGECYDDAVFDETVTINGGGTVGLASVTLGVAAGEQHDGTAGTGARIRRTAGAGTWMVTATPATTRPITVRDLELDASGVSSTSGGCINTGTPPASFTCERVIYHGKSGSTSAAAGLITGNSRANAILNCIVYNIEQLAGSTNACYGIDVPTGGTQTVLNCTVYNIKNDNGANTGNVRCYNIPDSSSQTVRNCIGMGAGGSSAGAKADFGPSSFTSAIVDHCLSSDATASGTGSLTGKSAANQFVSTTSGAEDLHLKAGADAIDAGTDLGTSPTGVNVDIDGRDRDAEGDTWDIGAHEFVSAGPSPSNGDLAVTLDDATLVATGTVDVAGTVAATLDDATLSATATVEVRATVAVTLDNASLAATGTVEVRAAVAVTLDDAALTAAGTVAGASDNSGSLTVTLDDATLLAAGTVAVSGTVAATLDDATLSAAATVDIRGSLTVTLDDATLAADGVVGNAPVSGSLAVALDDATLAAVATVAVQGAAAVTLNDAVVVAAATVAVAGALAATLADATVVATGTVANEGVVIVSVLLTLSDAAATELALDDVEVTALALDDAIPA